MSRPFTRSGLPLLCAAVLMSSCIDRPIIESLPDMDFSMVATGLDHACGVNVDGEVFCWSRANPVPTEVSGGIDFAYVSTYWDHTCGVAVDGTGYCWGENVIGQLGVDTTGLSQCRILGTIETVPCANQPTEVAGNLSFSIIETGAAHTCGLTTSGEVWCWGANGSGQLGAASAEPCDPAHLGDGSLCSFVPVRVDSTRRFTTVSTGLSHTCAVDDAARAWCWGSGATGRLGAGDLDNQAAPALVSGGHSWQSVDAGGSHTCGITTDGDAYCWGSNSDLQAGSGDTDLACGNQIFRCLWTPRPVSGGLQFERITASDAVPAGGDGPLIGGHTCGITTSQRVYCWGLNSSGQLVNHDDLRSADPVAVTDEHEFAAISAGRLNTCGITTDMDLLCWAEGGPATRYFVFN